MKKGQKKRVWTKEDKLKIIKRYSEEHLVSDMTCILQNPCSI